MFLRCFSIGFLHPNLISPDEPHLDLHLSVSVTQAVQVKYNTIHFSLVA